MTFFDLVKGTRPPLIVQALDDLRDMLETTHVMFDVAAAHLLANEPPTLDLAERDRSVNERERTIRRAVLEHMAIDPDRDMVFSLTLLSIVQDAERIGDLAKGLVETAALARHPRSGDRIDALRAHSDRVAGLFDRTRRAFVEEDVAAAQAVMDDSRAVKEQLEGLLADLAGADDLTPNEALVLGLAARLIGRVGSHLSNIASAVALPFDQIRRSDESI